MYEKKRVLLIEDNEADVYLIERALAQLAIPFDISRFRDGADALPALLAAQQADLPDIILLDVRMPRSNGLEVLKQIRAAPKLYAIPVGILTSSETPSDRQRASTLGASRYIHKASYLDLFTLQVGEAVQAMLEEHYPTTPPAGGNITGSQAQ